MKRNNAIYMMSTRDIFRLGYSIRMAAEDSDTAELMLYGEIISDIPESWKWSKEDKSAADFKKAIDGVIEKGAKKLFLRINSPGGVCTEAVAMRSILANAGFEEINIRIEGLCASAATDIATLPGAHVAIAEGSEYMIHNPWCITWGNANDLMKTIDRLRNIEQMSRSFYMAKTGQDEEKIKEWMDAETWFTAEQAVEYGFADELLKAETSGETPAAACVSTEVMNVMKSLYKTVPDQIAEKEPVNDLFNNAFAALESAEGLLESAAAENNVSNGTPVAGVTSEINQTKEENPMELENLTLDQLRDGNPALFAQVQQDAVAAERARLDDIDALTMPGYEEMAAQAKADGTSGADFHKQLVAAMKKRGNEFIQARQAETAPAQNVAGGEATDGGKTEEQEIEENAKEIAKLAKEYTGGNDGMF